MAQEFTVKDFKVGDFKDQNGNSWCNVVFEEQPSEQYRWVVKDPSRVTLGTKVYGHVEEKTSQAGKPYMRFYKEQNPEQGGSYSGGGGARPARQNDDHTQESIARSVALKAAVDYVGQNPKGYIEQDVITQAEIFLAWLQNSGSQGDGQPAKIAPEATNEAQNPQPAAQSNPKRPWENRQPQTTTEFSDNDMPFEGDSINLDEIPF